MKLFYNMICNISFLYLVRVPGIGFRSLYRGFIICRIPWLSLLLAFLTGIAPAAHAATGGTVLWQIRDSKTGIQMPTVPTGSAVDSDGNIYITGYQKLIGGTSGEDYYTIKVTKAGVVDTGWGPKTHNEANEDDRATSIAVDSDNNVIVAGNVTMGDGSKHIHIVKYSGINGNILWEHTFEPSAPAHTSDTASSIAVYGGYVYVAGVARVSGSTNDDILILKYDNSYSDGLSHAPVAAVVYDRDTKQDVGDYISAAAGGVAVVGRTWDGTEFDMLTLKYDLNLTDATKKAWQHSSPGGNSAGNNGSWGRFAKVDPDGNVIASGFDISSSTDKDIYTAKYCDNPDPATCNGATPGELPGALAWERRYQGSFADDVKGLAVDAGKDVYITGVISPMSSSNDFYTARYNGATGTLAWEARTDGGSLIDMANALVVDDSGEVYVTGYAKLNGVDTIQTMKYRKNATSGRLLWQKTFKNPDNPAGNPDMFDIRGTGIGLSSDGVVSGVVVSGWASKLTTPNVDGGSATAGSINTTTLQDTSKTWTPSQYANYYLKITAAGANSGQVRAVTGNTTDTLTVSPGFPAAVSAGDSYEIYSLDTDYYALKYEKGTLDRPTDLAATTLSNSSVHLVWADNSTTETGFKLERCKGKGCDFSVLDATITLGADVTGYDDNDANNTANGTPILDPDSYYYYRIKCYTAAPAEESEYSNSARGLTVFLAYPPPSAGNIFTYDGTDHQEDTSPAVAVGPDNNPVVTGRSFITGDGFDFYTVKLDRTKLNLPAGVLWSAQYDGGQYDNDQAACLAVDKDNKVIVSGDSVLPPLGGGANMNVLMTVQYLNPPAVDGFNNPTHSWSDQYNGPGKLDDHATAVATDAAGNFVVVGQGKKDTGNHQYVYVVKYNADKTRAWDGELFDAGVNGRPAAVAFGADGNIFVSGQRHNGTDFDCFTLKFCGITGTPSCNGKTQGQIIWQDIHDSGRGDDYAKALTVDAANNVYAVGSAINTAGNRDFYSIKYDGAATTPVRIWEGGGLSLDGSESGEAVAARIDPVNGDLLVAGTVLSDPGNHDFGLLRYKADGTTVWKKVLFRPDNDDYVIGMALDASGNAFVTGNTSYGSGTASMTIQFDSDSKVIQSNIYNASPAQEDKATSIVVNSLNEAFVAGTTRTASIDYLLYKIPVWKVQAPAPITVTPDYTTLAFAWPATSTDSNVQYKWKRADGACSDSSAFGAESAAFAANSLNDSGLPQNTTYCYSFKTTATSGDSRWVSITSTTATPGAPSPFSAIANNTTQITLSGTVTTTGQTSFEIQRCTGGSCDFSSLDAGYDPKTIAATGNESTITHVDTTVCPGITYKYRIRSVGTASPGWSSTYSTASATAAAIPVTAITVTPTTYSESQINLSWNDTTNDETGFEIWRCNESTGCTDFALLDTVVTNITSYGSTGLTPNASYRFKVRPYKTAAGSCGGGWYGSFSNIAGPTQALYTKPTLSKTTPNTTQLNLSWGDTTSSESSFLMQRCTGSGCTFDAGYNLVETVRPLGLGKDTTQTWSDTSVCTSTDYQYRVKPVNNGIQSGSGCWNKSTSLDISNFKADFITRVKISGNLAGYAGMKDDFSDIRIYDETAKKELPYWIESKSDTNWAIVWFKTGSSNNIKLYYDNASATATSDLSAVFGSGVKAFFPFGEAASTNGTSYDKSGLANNLTLNFTAGYGLADPGAARLGPDSGNVISANGTNGRYAYKNGTNLPSGGTATIEAWIYPKSPQTNGLYNGIVSFGENLQAQRVYLSLQDNGRPAMLGFNNDFIPATGPQAVFNAWNHIAVVLNGTTSATLYMNGQPVSGTLSGNLVPVLNGVQYLRVGVDHDQRAFNGFIDDVRIYDRALTASDIAMRYASVLPSVIVGTASGSSSCLTFSGGWGDDTFYSATLPVTMAAPVPPATLNVVANNEARVTLTWTNKTADQTGFKVFRCAGSGCSFAATPDYTIANTAAINTTVTYVDTIGLVPGTLYKYKVQAYKTGVGCPWDSAADTAPTLNTVTMPLPVPSALSKAYSFASACNDLRFTDSDGSTILSHWLESGCNTSATKTWLKFTSLPTGSKSIYLHYNNPAAAAPAVPDLATFFDFYDDFAGTTLDSSKWTKVETCGSHITQNNGLIVDGGCSSYTDWGKTGMYSVSNFSRPFVLEFSHNRTGGNYAMFGVKNTTANIQYANLVYGIYPVYDVNGSRLITYQENVSSADNLKPIASNVWQYYKIEVPATGASYYHGSVPVPSANYSSGYTQFNTSSTNSVTPLKLGMDVHSQAFTLGNVKIRKYASPEPAITLLPEQAGSFLTDGAWKIKRQIDISNTTGAALANHQMPVFVDTTPLAVDQIQIGWTNNTISEEGYIIERCDNTANSGNCATAFNVDKTFTITGNGITSYADREIKSNNAYCYRVSATRSTAPAWTTAATSPICETARQQQAPVLSAVGTTTQIKLDWTEADFASESGTATGGSTTTLTHSGKSWGTNQWSGYYLKMTGGAAANIGVSRKIASNTNTIITVDSAYPAAIANTHGYQIVPADGYGSMLSGIIGEYGYEVERCQDSGSGCTPAPMDPKVILAPNAARTYTDLLCSGSYNYRVHVVKYGQTGTLLTAAADAWPDYSNTVSANITSAPAPTKVKAVRVSEAQLTLTWQDNTGDETGFNIYRCKDVGGVACTNFALLTTAPAATGTASGSPAGTGTTVTYNDTRDIAPDSTYRYQVKAVGTGAICPTWESLAGTPDPSYTSGEARATTTNAAPSDLNVISGNTTQVNVNWNDNTASEGAIILERCSGVGCSDFSYLNNLSGTTQPAKQYKAFYPFASDLKDNSGSGLNLVNSPTSLTPAARVPYFNDGLYLCNNCDESFQSPVTGILDTDTHAIEFDFKIRTYHTVRTKVFGYTVATATPDKSSPGVYVPANGSGYGLAWIYLDNSGGSSEIHIGVNGLGDTSTAFTVNQWYHIRGEKSGNSFKVYLNGALIGSTTVVSPQYSGNFPLTFGRDATNTNVARINLKNFSIDGNVQSTDSSQCAGTTYSYRTRAVMDGFASSRVTIANFQPNFATRVVIPASIVAGRSASQINDIRFYDYTAKADIPYWLESIASDGTAIVWIKTGANNTITLYSNKNATSVASASDGAKVFDFFDDFTYSAASDPGFTSRWGVSTGGTVMISGGKLNVTTGSVYSQNAVSALATPLGKVFEMKNSWTTAATGGSGLTVCNAKDTYSGNATPYYAHADLRLSSASGLQAVAGDGSIAGWNVTTSYLTPGSGIPANSDANIAGQDRIVGVEYQSSTNLNFYSKDPGTYLAQYLPAATTYSSVWNPAGPTAPYLFLGHIWGSNAAAAVIYPMNVDWVRVRPSSYPNPEPLGTIDSAVAFPTSLTAWQVSTPVLIANFQPNYQTRLIIAKAALMNNDFSDLRFYDTTAQAELQYWIESKTDGVSATLWVKTGATNTVAMYYGNSSATSTAVSATSMFDLFDDFTTLEAGRWSKSDAAADITVDGSGSGTVRINSGALVSNSPIVSNPQNYAFEMKTYLVAPTNVWFTGLVVANAQTIQPSNGGGNAIARLNFNTSNFLQAVGADGTVASNNLTSPNLDNSADYVGTSNARIVGVGFPGSNPVRFFSRNPDSYVDKVAQVALNGTWQSPTTNAHLILGHVFGLGGVAIDTSDLVIDWVRVRRYAYPEPQASVDTGQFPGNLNPGSGGSGSWTAGSLLTINNFKPDFQTRMTVNYISGMQTDFRDIRFYDTTAKVELPYWIESYTSGSTATVWLKTGLNSTIAMYYGNNLAVTTSNGSGVFEFFDDFATLDTSKWSKSDPAAGITVDGSGTGKLRINTGAVYSNAPLVSTPQNWVYEMKNQWTGTITNYSQLMVSDRQYFLSGNSGASTYATNRLQNTGSLYAQAADGTSAANNVTSEAYPVAASPYSMAPLNTDGIIGLEFQGDVGKISYFSKNPTTYVDQARVTKSSAISLKDTSKNRATNGWTYGGGYYVKITSGINNGLTSGLAGYTNNSIAVSTPFPNFFSVGDTYEVRLNSYNDLAESGTMTGLWNSPMYLWLGSYLGSGTGTAGGGTADNTDMIVDWVRIRKYAATMPSVTVSAASVNQAPAPDMYQFLNNWVSPYSSTITVASPLAANLATNSDFENGTDKWTVGTGATEDATTAASGLKSLKISKALTANTSELASLPLPQMLPGGSYTLSGNIKANLTNGYAFCRAAVNYTTWDFPLAEYDVYTPSAFIWSKTNNSIPDNSNSSSTDGRIPLGVSTGGVGLSTSPYGTPTDRGDTGSVLGSAVIKESANSYRMWYSGNDHGTGGAYRIYYATSTNGIDWVKGDTTLPPVQDAGVTPAGNKGWLPLGSDVSGIGDRLHILASPAVIKDVAADGTTPLYKMWYTGHDRSYWRIYYATSPDGLNWTKYDNSVPAASDTTGTNGRIPLGTATAGDKTGVYAPTVVKDTSTTPATYKMWYSGSDGSSWRIYYAYSADGGLTWTKQNTTTPARSDASGSNGQIPLGTSSSGKGDDFYAYWPHVLWEGGQNYKMWYTGFNASAVYDPTPRIYRIFHATSSDGGLTWTKQDNTMRAASDTVSGNYQLTNGSPLRGDSFGAIAPFVLKEDTNTYTMWYAGATEGGTLSIYRATTGDGGSSWTKQDNTIPARSDVSGTNGRIPKGANATTGDTMHAVFPSVIKEDATHYRMWYSGHDGANWRIFHATSADGLAWNKLDNSVQGVLDTTGSSTSGRLSLGSASKGDSYHVYTPNVIKENASSYKMWYDGHDGINPRGIYLATSTDGLAWTKVNNNGFTAAQDTGAAPGGGRLFIGTESPTTIGDCRQLRLGHGSVLWEGGSNYKMWYTGYNGSNWRIYLATSSDGGTSWVKSDNTIPAASNTTGTNGRIPLGLAGSGDSNGAGFPMVVKEDATHYRMWYSGADGSGVWRIYLATSSDGLTWTKQDTSVSPATDSTSINGRLSVGNDGKGDASHIQGLYVLKDGSTYRTWYLGYDQVTLQRQRIFHASQVINTVNLNDNQWHSFSQPITLRSSLSTTDAANIRIQCGISRDNSGTDGLVDTANFDMIQLVPNNLSAFNLTATKVSESQNNLAWSDMTTDESGYKIWRCKDPDQVTACTDFGASPIATVAAGVTTFQDSLNLQPNTTYRYKVDAYKNAPGSCNGGWESSFSNINFAKTDDAAPGSLGAKAIDTNRVDLSWTDKSTGESGFAIERSTDGVSFGPLSTTAPNATLVSLSTTTFSDMTACPSTTYTYRVRALNRGLSVDGGRGNNCAVPGDGWNKRKHLNINDFQPQYPISLYVNFVTGMKADFSDLRFFDATAGKELPYWIESVAGSPAIAKVWVKSGDNNNIDMYYGNTYAASAGNPANVFEFWDDFSGGVVDIAKWTVVDASGLSVSNGYLHGTNTTGQIKSIATFAAGKTLEYKAKVTKWADNPWYIGGFKAPARYLGWTPFYKFADDVTYPNQDGRGIGYLRSSDGYMYRIGWDFSYNSTSFPSKSDIMSADSMLYRVTAKDTANAGLHIDNLDRLDAQFKSLVLVDVANSAFTYADAPIVFGGSIANPGESLQVDWDWVRVRKFAATEPAVTLDFEVSSSSLTPSQTCFNFVNQWGDEAAGTRYYSGNSNPVTTATLFAPSNLAANEVTPTRIDLSWMDNTGSEESGFEIQDCGAGCTDTSATPVAVPANTTKYSFSNLTAGTDHCYRVRAVKSGACGWPSSYSAPAACVTLSGIIQLDANAQGPFAVKLDWNNVPNDIRGFEIEKKLVNGNFANIATVGNVLTYTDKIGIGPLKSYTYRVRKSDKTPRIVFSDSFSGGFNTQLWTADAGQSWRVADPLAIMNNNAMVSDTSNGTGTLTATPGKLEFYSKSKGNAGTIYEAISLNDLAPTQGDFDVQLDYAITKPINSSTQNTNNYVILRYDTYAPAGYQYKITLYRTKIKDTDNVMKDAYVAQYTEVVPNTTYKYIFPTSDLSGKLRIARTTGSDGKATVSLYTSSGGAWDLRKEIALNSALVVPTWLSVQQQLAANELANTDMKAEVSNITLSVPANQNPYSNEATVKYTYPANYPVTELQGNTINTTPVFIAEDGVCRP